MQLFGALLRGCCADLSFLNLSKNSFSHRLVAFNKTSTRAKRIRPTPMPFSFVAFLLHLSSSLYYWESEMSFSFRPSLWVCLLMSKSTEFSSVCKDKTCEYLSRAICHMTPDSSLCSSFCWAPMFTEHVSITLCLFFLSCFTVFYPQEGEGLAAAVPSVLQLGLQPHSRQPGFYEVAS